MFRQATENRQTILAVVAFGLSAAAMTLAVVFYATTREDLTDSIQTNKDLTEEVQSATTQNCEAIQATIVVFESFLAEGGKNFADLYGRLGLDPEVITSQIREKLEPPLAELEAKRNDLGCE